MRLIIKAGGQPIHEVILDKETFFSWTTADVRRELEQSIRNFQIRSTYWRFDRDDQRDKAGKIAELSIVNGDDVYQLDMYYDRQANNKPRKPTALKRGEKPYPLIYNPPLIERRDTGTERGYGLFALRPITRYTFITEYGGRVISRQELDDMDPCDKNYILPISRTGGVFDGRIQGLYTYDWYESQGLLAQFANDKRGTGLKGNVDYKSQPAVGGAHLTPSGEMIEIEQRKFLVATKDIAPGEELLLLNYGEGHQQWEEACEEARQNSK